MKQLALATIAALTLFTSTAGASPFHWWRPHAGVRLSNEHARISAGVHTGQLTRGETVRLRANEQAIRANRRAMAADGRITYRERAALNRQENRLSRQIYRQKHDRQAR